MQMSHQPNELAPGEKNSEKLLVFLSQIHLIWFKNDIHSLLLFRQNEFDVCQ